MPESISNFRAAIMRHADSTIYWPSHASIVAMQDARSVWMQIHCLPAKLLRQCSLDIITTDKLYCCFESHLLLHTLPAAQLYYIAAFCHKYIFITWAGIAQSVYRLATGWTVRGSNPEKARFSASIQTGPGAQTASYTIGTGYFLKVKRQGHGLTTHPF
jgi:hypothetical protein